MHGETNVHRYSDTFVTLTEAQRQVMELMAQGKSHAQTARLLHLSIATVRTHTKNVRSMLPGVNSTDVAIVRLRGLRLLE